ncbi:MAG TPA: protein phosphatase 2C domain-containing protein, partial [Candidatus Binataceae bacterium]|nr:protein phosphatase 2C domain-containing protein [Candidatus Binataceae bacterium]
KTRDLAPLADSAMAAIQPQTASAPSAAATESAGAEAGEAQTAAEPAQAACGEPNASAGAPPSNGDQRGGDHEEAGTAAPGDEAADTNAAAAEAEHNGSANGQAAAQPAPADTQRADLGEAFERVLALSQTVTHPAYYRAREGFAQDGRVYLLYRDEQLTPFVARGQGPVAMPEHQALNVAIQICQAISYLHNRGMRVNDICPDSLAYGADGRVKLTSLDYISNDDELQSDPILNDGYTAPEIYRARGVDKRADVFSAGCVLYNCLTGERIECETWREEAGPTRYYPPYVISPELEKVLRRALAFRPADRWPGVDQFKAELLKLNSRLEVRSGCLTHVGMVRELNEDSVMALEFFQDSQVAPGRHYLYVVSDGMGGAAAGEIASAIAVETIQDYVEQGVSQRSAGPQTQSIASESAAITAATAQPGKPAPSLDELLQAALEEANRKVVEYQTTHPELRGMGATAVSALVAPPDAAIAWVGDSRAYLYESGKLRQLSKDHSLVQRLVEIGQITAEEARYHEHKNVITRSLGARVNGPAGAEALRLRLKRGDRLMLCSDGLIAHVEDSAIAEVLARREDPVAASRELVVAANAGGGTDNVSVIVIAAE